jgi:hypothetical protein
MEYAADMIGTTLNCTELMLAGEVGDEEASAVSAALTIMLKNWAGRAFTAMDVVKAMTPEMQIEDPASADAIADALGELVGKRLDRPTARSIGKLLSKRMVGRPAWIGGGQAFATLKRSVGHNANTYQIHVSASGQAANSSPNNPSSADGCRKRSPHSPPEDPGDGDLGNEGRDGNDLGVDDVVSSNAEKATPSWSGRL